MKLLFAQKKKKIGILGSLPPQFAQGQLYVWEFLTEFIVELFFQIRWSHIVNHRCHVRGKG